MSQTHQRNYDAPLSEIETAFEDFILPIIQHPIEEDESPIVREQVAFVAAMVANWELRAVALMCHKAICWAVENPEKQNLFTGDTGHFSGIVLRKRIYGIPGVKNCKIEYKYFDIYKHKGKSKVQFELGEERIDKESYVEGGKKRGITYSSYSTPFDREWWFRLDALYVKIGIPDANLWTYENTILEARCLPRLGGKNPELGWAYDVVFDKFRPINMQKFYDDCLLQLIYCFVPKDSISKVQFIRFWNLMVKGLNASFFKSPFPKTLEDQPTY